MTRSPYGDPIDAPDPRARSTPALDDRLANLERGLASIHGAVAEDLASLKEALDERTARLDHRLQQLQKLQGDHHFVLQEALEQAPAANRHLGDLHRSLAERMNNEHRHLQQAREQSARELEQLGHAAAQLRQLVNEVLPATHEATDKALANLAKLASEVEVERANFDQAIKAALHEHQEGQRWLVMVTTVGGGLTSALVTLGIVVAMKYAAWI